MGLFAYMSLKIPDGIATWEEEIALEGGEELESRICGSIFRRMIWFKDRNLIFPSHRHKFDHAILVINGSVRIRANDQSGERYKVITAMDYTNPIHGAGWSWVAAETDHEITSLTPYTLVACIFAHRGPHGEVVNKYNGNSLAYV